MGALRGAVVGTGEGAEFPTLLNVILSPTGREKWGGLRIEQCFLSQ